MLKRRTVHKNCLYFKVTRTHIRNPYYCERLLLEYMPTQLYKGTTWTFSSTTWTVRQRLWSHPTCWRYINESIIIIIIIVLISMWTKSNLCRCKCSDVVDGLLGLFLAVFRCLRVQMGVSAADKLIQLFISLFTRYYHLLYSGVSLADEDWRCSQSFCRQSTSPLVQDYQYNHMTWQYRERVVSKTQDCSTVLCVCSSCWNRATIRTL